MELTPAGARPLSATHMAVEAMNDLRSLAIGALARMYRPEEGLFAHHLRPSADGEQLEGISRRYTAIVLLALAGEAPDVVSGIFAGQDIHQTCGRLIDDIERTDDLGEAALVLWAARVLNHPAADRALGKLQTLSPAAGSFPTVEVAWSLTALTVEGAPVEGEGPARAIAERLLASFNEQSALFPHWPLGATPARFRSHVSCFADLVYPIQALSHFHRATGDQGSLDVARRCAERTCSLQGADGQWWWHYDVRTGRVIERFPVYAVHQDAMAPMALFDLQDAGGGDYRAAIDRGVSWLLAPPEIPGSLVDRERGVIWRKVARREPGKLTRSLQAAASRLHPRLRAPGVDWVFPPGKVDYESRPYHMGWLLYAWPARRLGRSA